MFAADLLLNGVPKEGILSRFPELWTEANLRELLQGGVSGDFPDEMRANMRELEALMDENDEPAGDA